ncbi:3-hydroxybutyryl-CoA dehydrogenase [Paenibacillus phyllosphaerae]|uniref:3-hydroxybutyryl-CoA dehydrogenase n=1 Tax=Paenibacillus phyllosphaerae TaxID=274593 RepID=A0A7W5FM86_9BACL|nr:3-hydroxyacyl-CoA dehydrogenase NAD-binding domain-containing protein [Paenibacillus phyllosphaerae]MBB3110035.1 3-hydroxybutyryl-CoA dehydrogenase [Paenibacillus phyllosphaerae]
MGLGIAQTAASSGYAVIMIDVDLEAAVKGIAKIDGQLSRLAAKGRINEEQRLETLGKLRPAAGLKEAGDAAVVIEAAPEHKALKLQLFRELDQICDRKAVLASNTSSIPITEIAAAAKHDDRVIGMHFMNPVPVMPLVEVIRGLATSDEAAGRIMSLAQAMGKTPVEVRDVPGFAANRILMPMINEAIYTVYEGVASPAAVDQVMMLGMRHPMGPITLADFIGLDTCLSIMETLHQGFGDPKYRPCPLLRSYVAAGWLGRKTGRGFYVYEEQER